MNIRTLALVSLLALLTISPALAQDTELDTESDSEGFNLAGYLILIIAGFGWMFFLGLLGFGIYLIIRKSRVLYEPKTRFAANKLHMLRRYCPPTLKSASVIWPSEAILTVSINSSNTLPPDRATSCSCLSAAVVWSASLV